MINFIICDDIKAHSDYTETLINDHCKVLHKIYKTDNIYDIYKILREIDINIIFMDIVLENSDKNGIELIKDIQKNYPNIIIVFTSGYNDYFEAAYEVDHIYFLKKPYNVERFNDALNKTLKQLENIRNNYIIINNKGSMLRLQYNDILYIESHGHNINISLVNGSYEHINGTKLSDIEKNIDSGFFVRCHQSYIVNMSKIYKIEKQSIFLDNNIYIPISKKYLSSTNNQFTLYLGGALCQTSI